MVSLLRPSWSLTESERRTVLCVRRSEVGTEGVAACKKHQDAVLTGLTVPVWGFPLLQEKIFLQPPEEISEALLACFDFWTHLVCTAVVCIQGFLYFSANLEKSGRCQFKSDGAYSIAPPNTYILRLQPLPNRKWTCPS